MLSVTEVGRTLRAVRLQRTSAPTVLESRLPLTSRGTVLLDDILGVVALGVAKEEIAPVDALEEASLHELFAEFSATYAPSPERNVDDAIREKAVRRLVLPEVRERVHPVATAVETSEDEPRVRVHFDHNLCECHGVLRGMRGAPDGANEGRIATRS
jgi:hypothetical protein